jgi:hypothetical protein
MKKNLGALILVVLSLAVASACASSGGSTPTRPSTDSGENWARTAPTASGSDRSAAQRRGDYWKYPTTSRMK